MSAEFSADTKYIYGEELLIYYSYKIQLCPNEYQEKQLFLCAHTARFAYNWALEWLYDYHFSHHHILQDGELRKIFTQFKQLPENQWLYSVSNNIPKQAIKDACSDFADYIFNNGSKPRYKKRKFTHPSFFNDGNKLFFTETHVKLEKLGTKENKTFHQNFILLAEPGRIPLQSKYENPRIYYDGLRWWITLAIDFPVNHSLSTLQTMNDGIGIDLGLINFATLSDGTIYPNINKSSTVKSLEKRKRKLRNSLHRKYNDANLPLHSFHFDYYTLSPSNKSHEHKNIIKTERQLHSIQNRLYNIRVNHINHIIKDILSKHPAFIVVEDLAVKKIMEDTKLKYAIKNQYFYLFRKKLQQKCAQHNIPFIIADRYFPSTKKCCHCGKINTLPSLATRIYKCTCGNEIDRDLQAAINLKNYMYEYANSEFKPMD